MTGQTQEENKWSVQFKQHDHVFKFHPFYLIRDYLENRKKSKKSSPLLSIDSLSTEHQLEHLTLTGLMSYYGFYNTIFPFKLYMKDLNRFIITALGAIEYYPHIFSLIPCLFNHKSTYIGSIILIIVDILSKYNSNPKYLHFVFHLFIQHYITVNYSKSRGKYTICAHHNYEYSDCISGLYRDTIRKIYLGYLMVFAAEIIDNHLHTIKHSTLKNILIRRKVNKNKASVLVLQMKRFWNMDKIVEIGQMYIVESFRLYTKMALDESVECVDFDGENALFYIMGQLTSLIERKYCVASVYYTISVCSAVDLYERVLGLISLSDNCYENGEYLLGLKLLKCAYILSKGYILKTFVNNEYREKKKKLKMKCDEMKCIRCDRHANAGCCSGCMKVFYCSRLCQKIDWLQHGNNCDRSWKNMYFALKKTIMNKL